MKVYYIMKMFGELQKMGTIEIVKYNQIAGGWHVVIEDKSDPEGCRYEMNIIPCKQKKEKVDLPDFMLN